MTRRFQPLLALDLTIGLGSFPRERASVVQSFDGAPHAKSFDGQARRRPDGLPATPSLPRRISYATERTLTYRSACASASIAHFSRYCSYLLPRLDCGWSRHTAPSIGMDLIPRGGTRVLAKPRTLARRRWFKHWRLSHIRRRLSLPFTSNGGRTLRSRALILRGTAGSPDNLNKKSWRFSQDPA